ncbi:rac GTPase-activating protein 1-like [Anoplophora glabripennis]|uniref:rac GTPase-activating protein 1-like n=1 Tax=Anoplophora glabripennis TaxID=217634 RepID=UPI00087399DC|nr:rac GTPase-activating protein 1-like [Anoplophora glabripennis]
MAATTPFKTPLPYSTPKSSCKGMSDKSDSDESTSASDTGSAYSGSSGDLTIVALFDDLIRLMKQKRDEKVEEAFRTFAENMKVLFIQWQTTVAECQRLQNALDIRTQEFSEMERHLNVARRLLDEEKKRTKQAKQERDEFEQQIGTVRKLLFKDNRTKLADETREQFAFLNKGRHSSGEPVATNVNNQLSAIPEVNSTGSIMSDFSFSRSEDDLDSSKCFQAGREWRKHRASTEAPPPEPAAKKRRSSGNKVVEIGATDTVRATTTLTVTKEGPIKATSIIESLPQKPCLFPDPPIITEPVSQPGYPPVNLIFDSWNREGSQRPESNTNLRQHCFQQKTVVMPGSCTSCEKRIRFGRSALKCRDCRAMCHLECKDFLPLPCVPAANTPGQRNLLGIISDYTPTIPPMVPALIVHCLKEIEQRGLNEIGLYRIPGSEKDVKSLKERFICGRGSPNLKEIDIHVICGCVKIFLRSLTDPLITYKLWNDFVQAVEAKDERDIVPTLYQVISELPQPNRDTLAYMILHLQKIAESPECKMPIENLSKVFGPTIVGYSSEDPNPNNLITETRQQGMVMERLLKLPSEYWSSFINVSTPQRTGKLQQTPSTDSLLRPTSRIFTPRGINNNPIKRKQRFFATPPSFK